MLVFCTFLEVFRIVKTLKTHCFFFQCFCYSEDLYKSTKINQKIRQGNIKNQRKSPPESLSKQRSKKDSSNLAKNVPWDHPGLQNGTPDRPQEAPDESQNPSKIRLLGIWDIPAATNRSQDHGRAPERAVLATRPPQNGWFWQLAGSRTDMSQLLASSQLAISNLATQPTSHPPAPPVQPIFQQRERGRRQWA